MWQKMRKLRLNLMRVPCSVRFKFRVHVTEEKEDEAWFEFRVLFWFKFRFHMPEDEWLRLDLIRVSSSPLIRVPSSRDRRWGSWGWIWCEFRIPLWHEFRVNLIEDKYLMWLLSSLWFEFWINVTEDEEADTWLDSSSVFPFGSSFDFTW